MKPLRLALVGLLAGALALGAVGCQSDKDLAARVNGEPIKIEEVDRQVEQLKKQYPDMFKGAEGEGRLLDFKQRIVDNLVNQKLVAQAAEERGIKVTDADVDKQIEQLRAGFSDAKQFQQALASAGMTEDSLEKQIREQIMTQRLVESLESDAKVSEADVKAYYDKNKTQFFQKPAKRASHILFKPEDEKTAKKVLQQIQAKGDFAALAKQYSVDTATKSKGGDLGWPTTAYVTEFETALGKLKKGQTSGLVKTPYGWHIIRVTDTRSGKQQSLTEVKPQIEQIIVQQRRAESYQKFLEAQRKDAKIEILLADLKDGGAATKSGQAAPQPQGGAQGGSAGTGTDSNK